jgi:AAHS family 4-hydroxybenzoate transporter-like MFS transporter
VQFLLSYWLPTLLLAAGVTVKATGLIASAAKVGSIAGGLTTGWLMDRKGAWRVLACTCGGGAVAAVVLGASTQWILVALALIIVCYFLIDGSFGGVLALTASSYPPAMRATGTGWVSGLARLIGGGGGTLLGGFLVAAHWSLPQIAALLAAPMAAACLALLLAMRLRASSMGAGMAEPAAV